MVIIAVPRLYNGEESNSWLNRAYDMAIIIENNAAPEGSTYTYTVRFVNFKLTRLVRQAEPFEFNSALTVFPFRKIKLHISTKTNLFHNYTLFLFEDLSHS